MLEHAFKFARTVVFWVAAENIRSRRAMTRIGGVLREGEFAKSENGVSHPYVICEITQQDFLTSPLNSNFSAYEVTNCRAAYLGRLSDRPNARDIRFTPIEK